MTRWTRQQQRDRVLALLDAGLSSKQAAERLGLSYSHVRSLISDPDGTKVAARKKRSTQPCADCATPIRKDPRHKLCAKCARRRAGESALWTQAALIERVGAWVEAYGEIPGAQDWNPDMARTNGRHDIADRFYQDGCWPHVTTVVRKFGSWNALISAAGYTPRRPGGRRRGPKPLAHAAFAMEDQ